MIRSQLAHLMADKKVRIADVSRATQLNRSTLTTLYYETMVRIDIAAIDTLCAYFGCEVGQLFQYVPSVEDAQKI